MSFRFGRMEGLQTSANGRPAGIEVRSLHPVELRAEKRGGETYLTGYYLNANDVRTFEKMNPIGEDWAEEYWMPVNMTLVTTPINPGSEDHPPAEEPTMRAYARLFRDAYGRILAREKRDSHALQGCFGPLCLAIRDQFGAAASQEMRVQAAPGVESERFIADYLAGMGKRAAEWTAENAEETCRIELGRAVRAIRVAVYREMAAEKAKEPILIQ